MYADYIIVRSVTVGQRGKAELERSGIPVRLQRSPGSLSQGGCAYALLVRRQDLARAVRVLHAAHAEPLAVYRRTADGGFERAEP